MNITRLGVFASAAGAALALAGAAAYATIPGSNGLIIYQAQAGKHVQLFTIRPDGTHIRQLTRFADSDSVNAQWSADGHQVAFERDFANHAGIYTMNADGTHVRSLTPTGLQGMPSFSPDGKTIVFDRTLPKEDALWLMNADGTNLRQLTHNPQGSSTACRCDEVPVFSPNGKQIAFIETITDLKNAAFIVNIDGSGLKQLTPWSRGVSHQIDWSPDGSRILLSSPPAEHTGTASNVYTIKPDGTGLTQLTHETKPGEHDLADSYSPDGTKIIYAKNFGSGDGGFQVWMMNADGSDQHQLTHGVDAHRARWGSHR
jgi:Tol biopolymer transport system component